MKLDLILENVRNRYSLGLLEESEGLGEKEVLQGKIMITEATMNLRKMLVEEGVLAQARNLLEEAWTDALTTAAQAVGDNVEDAGEDVRQVALEKLGGVDQAAAEQQANEAAAQAAKTVYDGTIDSKLEDARANFSTNVGHLKDQAAQAVAPVAQAAAPYVDQAAQVANTPVQTPAGQYTAGELAAMGVGAVGAGAAGVVGAKKAAPHIKSAGETAALHAMYAGDKARDLANAVKSKFRK